MLEAALGKKTVEGEQGNKALARLVTELVTTGEVTLPNGKKLEASPRDWIETVKWVYAHVDGPPKTEIEHSGSIGSFIVDIDADDASPA